MFTESLTFCFQERAGVNVRVVGAAGVEASVLAVLLVCGVDQDFVAADSDLIGVGAHHGCGAWSWGMKERWMFEKRARGWDCVWIVGVVIGKGGLIVMEILWRWR